HKSVALYSDNSTSTTTKKTSPLTGLNIKGRRNCMADIPLHLFDSKSHWFCKHDTESAVLYNFPSPYPHTALETYIIFPLRSLRELCASSR
ncbi:hypothetical protein ACHAW6_008731, partial [Cyclotella cf. meneghiniana]